MKTFNTIHLGDGAYVGRDPYVPQIWLGANHHENMTVALGEREVSCLIGWLCQNGFKSVIERAMDK